MFRGIRTSGEIQRLGAVRDGISLQPSKACYRLRVPAAARLPWRDSARPAWKASSPSGWSWSLVGNPRRPGAYVGPRLASA